MFAQEIHSRILEPLYFWRFVLWKLFENQCIFLGTILFVKRRQRQVKQHGCNYSLKSENVKVKKTQKHTGSKTNQVKYAQTGAFYSSTMLRVDIF